jgi:predicted phosphodiesterase
LSLADKLHNFTFRNVGVETKVTSRADVEKAFANIKTGRVRDANDKWQSHGYNVPPLSESRESSRVQFGISEVHEFEVELLRPPSLGCIGAGVSKSYRDMLLDRLQACIFSEDPDIAWQSLQRNQVFQSVVSLDTQTPKALGAVRIVCISDTHGQHRKLNIPPGDLLLHGGDFTMNGELDVVRDFDDWLGTLPHPQKIVIAGNHDITFDPPYYNARGAARLHSDKRFDPEEVRDILINSANCRYLEGEEVEVFGLRVFGTPFQPEFCDWAFNLLRGAACREAWQQIPSGIDVLLVHGPPLGRGDLCMPHGNRAGCVDLLHEIQQRVRPKLCVSGHIHEGYGASSDGTTTYVNASSCTHGYKASNAPMVFDLTPSANIKA